MKKNIYWAYWAGNGTIKRGNMLNAPFFLPIQIKKKRKKRASQISVFLQRHLLFTCISRFMGHLNPHHWPLTVIPHQRRSCNACRMYNSQPCTERSTGLKELIQCILRANIFYKCYREVHSDGQPVQHFGPPLFDSCSTLINMAFKWLTKLWFGIWRPYLSVLRSNKALSRGNIGGPKWWTDGPSEWTLRHTSFCSHIFASKIFLAVDK